MNLLEPVLWVMAVAIAIPAAVLLVECLAAWLPRRRGPAAGGPRPTLAVLVPAHDEELVLPATLAALRAQLAGFDRLLVVADNCTDRTAEIARAAGAEVLERVDPEHRGKGFALAAGVDRLRAAPPEVVVFFDADAEPGPGAIDRLARAAAAWACPVQAVNLLDPPEDGSDRDQLSALAFSIRNLVRQSGLARLGLPVQLNGTGMAIPWDLVQEIPLASGNLVEDLQLGIDLAKLGAPPRLLEDALVRGRLPGHADAARSQRTRWEQGHLRLIVRQAPPLLWTALLRGRLRLLGLALDLAVPPVCFLLLAILAVGALGVVGGLLGTSWTPARIAGAALAGLFLAVVAGWARLGPDRVPASRLAAAPFYLLWKIPLYLGLLRRPEKAWVRTSRGQT